MVTILTGDSRELRHEKGDHTVKATASILAVGVALVCAGAAMAHEGHQHATHKVMGTVVLVRIADVNRIEVRTTHGDTITLTVDSATKYLKGKRSAALGDVKTGMRVIATVTTDGQVTTVSEIQLGAVDAP
jgi:Cu/Ag efflux protein CusF